jgi:hypothetical protein
MNFLGGGWLGFYGWGRMAVPIVLFCYNVFLIEACRTVVPSWEVSGHWTALDSSYSASQWHGVALTNSDLGHWHFVCHVRPHA